MARVPHRACGTAGAPDLILVGQAEPALPKVWPLRAQTLVTPHLRRARHARRRPLSQVFCAVSAASFSIRSFRACSK